MRDSPEGISSTNQDTNDRFYFALVVEKVLYLLALFFAARIFSFPWLTQDYWYAAWIGMAILLVLLKLVPPKFAFVVGVAFGAISISTSFYWAERMLVYTMNQTGFVPKALFLTLVILESLPFGVFGVLVQRSSRYSRCAVGLVVPFAFWIACEAWWPKVFVWMLGHTQQSFPAMVQAADIGGCSLVSLMTLIGAAIPLLIWESYFPEHFAKFFQTRQPVVNSRNTTQSVRFNPIFQLNEFAEQVGSRWYLSIGLFLLSSHLVYGYASIVLWNTRLAKFADYRIGVVQEDPSFNESIRRMRAASDRLGTDLDLLCWPESTLGSHSTSIKSFHDHSEVIQASLPPPVDPTPINNLKVPLIVGGRSFDGSPRDSIPQHQTAYVVDAEGKVTGHYHKRALMPLGEFVPFEVRFPFLHDWFQLTEYIVAGESDKPLTIGDHALVGILICYEDIVPEISRRTVLEGAETLVCIINASAFEDPVALNQHLQLAQMRTIENRRYLTRIAGTGVSCCISPTGKILKSIAPMESGEFIAQVKLLTTQSVFTIVGNWPAWIALAVLIYAMSVNLERRRRARNLSTLRPHVSNE